MLEHYRRELERFQEAIGRETFLFHSGQKGTLELSPVYERFCDLFRLDAIRELQNQFEITDPHFETRRRGISLLKSHAEKHFLELRVEELTEQILNTEARAVLSVDGQELSFLQIAKRLATEPDPEKRRQLDRNRLHLIHEVDESRQEHIRRVQEAAELLDYEDNWTMLSRWHNCDLSGYADQFGRFLEDTESLYHRWLIQFLSLTVEIPADEADHADVEYFLQLQREADLFPEQGVIPVYRETMRDLGIDPDEQDNVEIDLIQRRRKHPDPVCFPVRVPHEIKLSISLRGGSYDYEAILHGGGQVQRYVWTSPTAPVDFRLSDASALTEGYGFLFRYLTLDPLWLDELLHFHPPEEFIRHGWLKKLFGIRRQAARLHFGRILHTTMDLTTAAQQYASALTEATRFKYYAEDSLYDLSAGGFPATHLRAWLLEAQLREYLKTRFGKRWWRSRKAADFLIDLWNTGDRYTAEELARLADFGPLSLDRLREEISEQLT